MRVAALASLAVIVSFLLFAQGREKRVIPVDATARQTFDRQPKVAVLVGVGNYPSRSGLTPLRYPAHDVELMEAELEHQGYKVVALKDQEATRGSILQALQDAAELVDRGRGTVLFFFSGHGFSDRSANYLANFEATSSNLAASGLAVKTVEDLLKATGAPRQVMFIDACRNEAGKSAGARSFDRFEAAAGLRVLFSTKAGRISYEDDQLGSGVFTHFLVQGLRGEAAGMDGLVTFRDLSDYVTDGVSGFGFRQGRMQVPYEAGESSGDFLLGKVTSGSGPAVPPRTQVGSTKVNPKDGLTYVWIPPGTFQMGCSPGDRECDRDEEPEHNVIITNGFWIGQTEVTQEAFQRVMSINPSHSKGARLPVESVTWGHAQGYCQAADMRLPTEAEWEYAVRAGSTESRYGDRDRIGWDNANSEIRMHEVGGKQANQWGLYDMLGNVWEWVGDWFAEYQPGTATDPRGPESGTTRTLRGGSWSSGERSSRASYRSGYPSSYHDDNVGFRCAGN